MSILVTGAAGFIGMHVARALLLQGEEVVGLDNFNPYYDVSLKQVRLNTLAPFSKFRFERADIGDAGGLRAIFERHSVRRVCHLAAQAGVRHSISHPHDYASANLVGFLNVLEACRSAGTEHLVYASSSSVYGSNAAMPHREADAVDHPVSLYAATKKANEGMAHSYSHLYGLPTTGLRFFTVYGPWGRPDMSPVLFARAIWEGRPIDIFNNGQMLRDFTYIDDIAQGVVRVLAKPATPDPAYDRGHPSALSSDAPWRIFNIGNRHPVPLLEYVSLLENAIGKPAVKNFRPLQSGDALATCADTSALDAWIGFKPDTPLAQGLGHFVAWARGYYGY